MFSTTEWHGTALAVLLAATGGAAAADVDPSMLVIERFAAERGDANAQYFMGEHHELGDSGIAKDLGKALALYTQAAGQQHGPAQYKLGVFHEKGLAGLRADPGEAMQWYRRAAENGSTLARQRLAAAERAVAEAGQLAAREREAAEQQRLKAQAQKPARLQQRRVAAAAVPPRPASPTPAAPRKRALDASALLDHVHGTRWYEGTRAAEFLPTDDTSCLKTAASEVTCFSKERRRTVADQEARYSLKAVLGPFSAEGDFPVSYTYHVADLRTVAKAESAADAYGLRPALGWQQPARTARCRLDQPGRLQCQGLPNGAQEFRAR